VVDAPGSGVAGSIRPRLEGFDGACQRAPDGGNGIDAVGQSKQADQGALAQEARVVERVEGVPQVFAEEFELGIVGVGLDHRMSSGCRVNVASRNNMQVYYATIYTKLSK